MSQKIAITGSSGLVGSAVMAQLKKNGYDFVRIIRSKTQSESDSDTVYWNLDEDYIDHSQLEGLDAVIHLAGANIAAKRWSSVYKEEIKGSRVNGTTLLCKALSQLRMPPKALLSASAIGYYGPRDSQEMVGENGSWGKDFLAEVCQEWEAATQPAQAAGIRVVHMRIGMVLSKDGGALQKMLPPFLLGLGGKLGSGHQMMSWIALAEIPLVIQHLIEHEEISGPVNVVALESVSNSDFTKVFGQVIKRPTALPVPAFGARLLFGEMADALLLNGAKVVPEKLLSSGYQFRYPNLKKALEVSLR